MSTSLKLKKMLNPLFLLTLALFVFSTSLQAATTIVPLGTSIQNAINAAASGDTLQLQAGTYQLTNTPPFRDLQVINKNLTIQGAGRDSTIIVAPSAAPLAQFFNYLGLRFYCVMMVVNQNLPTPQTVNILDLTVDGGTQMDSAPFFYNAINRFYAIGYSNADGTVRNVHTRSTRQFGTVTANSGGGITNASAPGVVNFNVENCLVDTYQREGIVCRGDGVTANVTNCVVNRSYILPFGVNPIVPNGIVFNDRTGGTITGNTVELNLSSNLLAAGSGIIVNTGDTNILISGNNLTNNDSSIVGIQCLTNLTITNNIINYNTPPPRQESAGISIQQPLGLTTISDNTINNVQTGLELVSTLANRPFDLSNNQINFTNSGIQIFGGGAVGPVVTMNGDAFTDASTYYIQELSAPNDVWPSTATVSFDGLVSGYISFAQFNQLLTKIFDQNNDPALGLVLDFIQPFDPAPPTDFVGVIKKNKFLNDTSLYVEMTWKPSPAPNVAAYKIYQDGVYIALVTPLYLHYIAEIHDKHEATDFEISTLSTADTESTRLPITIVHKNKKD
jgi:hypothetical protein